MPGHQLLSQSERSQRDRGVPGKVKFPMAKTLTEIRSLARSHTRTALNVLVGVMRSKDATAAARVAEHAILAQGNRVRQPWAAICACAQAIADVALLEIDPKIAWRRPMIKTVAPPPAMSLAEAKPMPSPPPVMTAT